MTSNLNKIAIKRSFPFGSTSSPVSNSQNPTKKRKISAFNSNLAPSIEANEESRKKGILDKELVKEHANLRIQLFYTTALGLYKLGLHSDGTKREGLRVGIGSARYQVGSGTKGNHAAHANAGAGQYDNIRELVADNIQSGMLLTPKRKKILRTKGVSLDLLEKIEKQELSDDEIQKKIDLIWPKKQKYQSIFEDTDTMNVLNATNELPKELNLQCDKRLEEAVRPKMEKLYLKVLYGERTPEEACTDFHQNIVDHFNEIIPPLKKRAEDLKSYISLVSLFKKNLKNSKPLNLERVKKSFKHIDLKKRKISEPQKNLSNIKLVATTRFNQTLQKKLTEIDPDDNKGLLKIKKWLFEKVSSIKKDAKKKAANASELLRYALLEQKGSQLPSFELISGTLDPQTSERVPLSDEKKEIEQLHLLIPSFHI